MRVLIFILALVLSLSLVWAQNEPAEVSTPYMRIAYYHNASTAFRIDFLINYAESDPPVYMLWNYPPIREITPENQIVQRGIPIPSFELAPVITKDYIESHSFNNITFEVPPNPRFLEANLFDTVELDEETRRREIEEGLDWTERADGVLATVAASGYVMKRNYTFPSLGAGSAPIFVSSGGFKFSSEVDNWPFMSTDNVLQQRVHANFFPAGVLDTSALDEPISRILVHHPDGIHSWVIALQRECLLGNDVPVPVQPVNLTFMNPHQDELIISWVFPASNYIFYDPDVQALIGGGNDGSDGDGQSGDGNSNAVAIAVGVVVPVAVITVCCIVIVVVVLTVLGFTARNRRQRALTNSMNSSEI